MSYALTPDLHNAAKTGDVEAVEKSLSPKIDLEGTEVSAGCDVTPLIIASENGHLEIVRLLVNAGANVDAANEYGGTVLMYALSQGHIDIARLLVDKGAKVSDAEPELLMICAVQSGFEASVQFLLDLGLNFNAEDKLGITALQWAEDLKHWRIAQLLLKAGANLWSKRGSIAGVVDAADAENPPAASSEPGSVPV